MAVPHRHKVGVAIAALVASSLGLMGYKVRALGYSLADVLPVRQYEVTYAFDFDGHGGDVRIRTFLPSSDARQTISEERDLLRAAPRPDRRRREPRRDVGGRRGPRPRADPPLLQGPAPARRVRAARRPRRPRRLPGLRGALAPAGEGDPGRRPGDRREARGHRGGPGRRRRAAAQDLRGDGGAHAPPVQGNDGRAHRAPPRRGLLQRQEPALRRALPRRGASRPASSAGSSSRPARSAPRTSGSRRTSPATGSPSARRTATSPSCRSATSPSTTATRRSSGTPPTSTSTTASRRARSSSPPPGRRRRSRSSTCGGCSTG